jgi:ubiquinone/menaquinone biosynthesis C-methylase UbiE
MLGHDHHATATVAPTRGSLIRWARFYDPFVNLMMLGQAPAMREHTADLARIRPGESILEVGCGTGELTQRARARAGPRAVVCGIDAATEMIGVARRKAARAGLGIDYRVAAIEALPFADASFDVVLSSVMMHHLPDDLKRQGLSEVRRVLKPGGRLLIVDFQRPKSLLAHLALPIFVHHGLHHGIQDLPAMASEAGFTNIARGTTRYKILGYVSATAPA